MHGTDDFVALCTERLKLSGARITKPRLAVMRCLAASTTALTPREILAAIGGDELDQVTVYRVLETFSELGLVHQAGPAGGFVACTHLACDVALHILSHCKACDRTEEIDVPAEIMSPLRWYLTHEAKFRPEGHIMQVNGVCARCVAQ